MKNLKKKVMLISLVGLISANIMGCGSKSEPSSTVYDVGDDLSMFLEDSSEKGDTEVLEEEKANDSTNELESTTESKEENKKEEMSSSSSEENKKIPYGYSRATIVRVPICLATEDVEIRDGIDGNLLGVLPSGHSLELINRIGNTHYLVSYYGKEAYISAANVVESSVCDVRSDIVKMLYAVEPTTLYVPAYLSDSGIDEYKDIDTFEVFEVYDEFEESYLVQTPDYVGYISKEHLEELNGTYLIFDESDQELKMYSNNEVVLDCPVITGNSPKKGVFSIYDVTHDRYLECDGDSKNSWVSVMMNYDGNNGLCDAECRKDEDGREHGWRASYDFGGNTYEKRGSTNGVDLRYDDANFINANTGIGTIVLMKK